MLRILCPILLILIGLMMTAALWNGFTLWGHSAQMDTYRQLSFDRCIREGILFPRWIPDTYYGYGSPLFHFYGPLPYYATELFILAGVPIPEAIKATMVFFLILSGLAMYLFCRDFSGPLGSFLAGLAYMFAPYHLVDLFVRHAFGELVAFAFVPLIAWGLTGMIKGRLGLRFAVGATALAALIFTHNVTAMLGLGFAALWWMMLAIAVRSWRRIAWGAGMLACGLVIASFFWVPVMVEKDLTYAQESLTGGYFAYSDHFVHPAQLVVPFWGYGGSRKGVAEDRMSFQVGVVHLLFFLAAIVLFVSGFHRAPEAAPLVVYGMFVLIGSAFMMLPVSNFLWRLFPMLAFVQFPWRFLLFAAFGASILAVSVESLARAGNKPWLVPLSIGLAGALIVVAYSGYTRPKAMVWNEKDQKFQAVSPRWAHDHVDGEDYRRAREAGTLDLMRKTGEPGTSRDDYLPRTVDRKHKPTSVPAQFVTWAGEAGASVNWRHDGPVDLVATVLSDGFGWVQFARFKFPGWAAFVNGQSAPLYADVSRGTINVRVGPGKSTVELRFRSTPLRRNTGLVSLAGLLATVLYAALGRRRRTIEDRG